MTDEDRTHYSEIHPTKRTLDHCAFGDLYQVGAVEILLYDFHDRDHTKAGSWTRSNKWLLTHGKAKQLRALLNDYLRDYP